MPVHREPRPRIELAETAQREAGKVAPQQRSVFPPGGVPAGIPTGVGRCAVNRADRKRQPLGASLGRDLAAQSRDEPLDDSSSAGVNGDVLGGGAVPVSCSMSFIMSISILVARNSALEDLLTSCAMTAARLVNFRRRPL